ncbi:MAG TPA: NUDIX domain-containing protein [Ktedonobacteraceae bacterium]|nr:NUDIX domain-containing protein [Ktedonobacteraceae bacterium]
MTQQSSSINSRHFRIGVSALIFDEGRILLAHRRDIDWWNLPGGGMEIGETVEEALHREVREETGLEVEIEQLVGVYSKPQKQEVVLSFLCHATGGELTATEETRECCYFAPDDLPPNTLPKHRQRVEDALLHQERAILRNQLSSTEEDQRLSGLMKEKS